MSQEKKILNQEQKEAVRYGQGPLMIIAGAGSGKTTVITERIKYLVIKKNLKPSQILALTFTDKAAREMETRLDQALPYGYVDFWISTFHSFCDRLLRDEAVHIGLNPAYKLMSQAETIQFLIKNLFQFDLDYFRPLGNPTKFIEGILNHFSRLKDEDVTASEYLRWSQNQKSIRQLADKNQKEKTIEKKQELEKYLELARAYQKYEDLKIKEGVMDFGDLITNTLKLFRRRKNVLDQYRQKFKYILVDEFQDTNFAQNELAMLLAGPEANLTVTGDDDQCLPPGAEIITPEGAKKIEDIEIGDKVVSAVGKGYTGIFKVTGVFRNKRKTIFLTFKTKRGEKICVTKNHKMFCLTPSRVYGKKKYYYVYLMERIGLGWRLGVTNDLAQRLKLERSADRIIGIRSCNSEQEAKYYETLYSLKYKLPTVCFKSREMIMIQGKWMKKLYREIETYKSVEGLAADLGIDLNSHHFCLGAVVRGDKTRVKVNLRICKRNHRTKWARNRYLLNPDVYHEVSLETSDKKVIALLKKAGLELLSAKKGLKVRKSFSDMKEAGAFAEKLLVITGGIFEFKFDVAKRGGYARHAQVMPASNVLLGLYLPVLKKHEIIYDEVVSVKAEEREEETYDLEVEKTHNFIADNVVVHNSIYRFRGAAIANIIQFKKNYPQTKIVVLSKNYRSTQTILNHAYRLIQYNNPDRLEVKEGVSKHLQAIRGIKGKPLEFIFAARVEDEAEAVAAKIGQLKDEQKYQWKEFAILVRANNHARPFTRSLARAGIPYQFLGPGQLFQREEVKDLIAYLKLLYNFEDNVACYRVINMDHFNLFSRDLAAIGNYARRFHLSFFEACEQIEKVFVAQETKEKIAQFVKMVHRHLGLLAKETAGQIVYYFLEDSGLLKKLTEYKTPEAENKAQNIAKFFDRLKTYEVEHEDASVAAVVDWINLSLDLGESPLANNFDWDQEDRVNLLTVHSSKGLEFPVVFLVNLVADRFPTRERREQIPLPEELIKEILPEGDYHLQEERRLFYVGMTRAKDYLFLTAAKYYGEGKREKKISHFVTEVFGEDTVGKTLQPTSVVDKSQQLSILDFAPQEASDSRLTADSRQLINYLSFSQIDTFNTCPLQYRYRFLQRIPVPASAAQTFGEVMHKTLKEFYQPVKQGRIPSLPELKTILDKNWSVLGYSNRAHEKRMKKQGKIMLTNFYQKGFDPKAKVKELEQVFDIKLAPDLKVGGRIDRIDETAGIVEIYDYKTGQVWEQKRVDDSLQMTLYAMAVTSPKSNLFYHLEPEEVILSFYFLGTGEKKTTRRNCQDLEKAYEKLLKKREEITKSNFPPTPGPWCDFCDYKLICEAWS